MTAYDLSPTSVVVLGLVTRAKLSLNAQQLSSLLGMSLSCTREAIDALVAAGLLVQQDDFLRRTASSISDLSRQMSVPSPSRSSSDQWRLHDALQWATNSGSEDATAVQGGPAVRATLTALNLAAPREMLSMSPRPVHQTLHRETVPLHTANLAMVSHGTESRWVTDESRLRIPALRKHVDELVRQGEFVYAAPEVSHRMSIYDRQVAVVPLDPSDQLRGCLVVRNRTVIAGLIALYRETLDRSTPVILTPEITEPRHSVLVLLAVGTKDEAIARKLNVSTRTVRRAVASLMTECGADSRFQLAVAAVRLGWLTAADLAPAPQLSANNSTGPTTD